jgi:spermidine synthase
MTSRRGFFLWLYAASGAAALVYEVAWMRLLTLQMGHTVAATSTVLAAFMGGLALGGWLGGLAVASSSEGHSNIRRYLRAYAALELVVAMVAVVLPSLLAAARPVLAWAYSDGNLPLRFAVVRAAVSLFALGLPTTAMGATYPIAVKWGRESLSQAHRSVGKSGSRLWVGAEERRRESVSGTLYAANTAGAAVGAIAAGFWLIPAVGLRAATWVGVALNVGAAASALWLGALDSEAIRIRSAEAERPGEERAPAKVVRDRTQKSHPRAGRRDGVPERRPVNAGRDERRPFVALPRLAVAAAAISGCAALIYEVAWTRLLALIIGPTTYAFATMAASFISGIALGAAAGTRVAARTVRPAVWLAGALIVAAIAASGSAWYAASRLPLAVAAQVASPDAAFGRVVADQAGMVALLLLPMALALGGAFPLALATVSAGAATDVRDAARVYVANTVGAIAGALAGGFVLIPQFGLHGTFHYAAMLGIVGGVTVVGATQIGSETPRQRLNIAGLAIAAGIVSGLISTPGWDHELLASGAYKYAPYLSGADLDTILRAGRLEYYKEGAAATVSVRQLAGTRSLAIDGKVDASNAGDMLTQRLLGLLPVLLHREARDVCIIGLGSGVTLGSALATGTVRHAVAVEISPEVVNASRFFDYESGRPLAVPVVRLIVGDGRSHLLLTTQQYDVIVSEPSNPWMAGVAALFTREFFEAARARLRPDGLLCQWAHTYDISSADLRSIVRTFAAVFPAGTMWLVGQGDLLLIGAPGNQEPDLNGVEKHWRRGSAPAALADVGITGDAAPFALLSLFAGGPKELGRYADEATIQTDDRMALEYSAPRGIYGRTIVDNARAIRGLLAPADRPPAVRDALERPTDLEWTVLGTMLLKAEAYEAAYSAFKEAVTVNGLNGEALSGLTQAAAGAQRGDEERSWLQSLAASQPTNAMVRLEVSRILAASGDYQGAAAAAQEAMRLLPGDPRPSEQIASILADVGDADRLEPLANQLITQFPARAEGHYYRASALLLRGKPAEAVEEARKAVKANPHDARAQNLLGAACGMVGQRECAAEALDTALRANPRDPTTYVNLGVLHLQSGNPSAAIDAFAQALTLDPTSRAARDGLNQAKR